MKISPEEVERLAKLAWLKLDPEEVKRYSQELSSILDYVETLNQLDTSQVSPTYHVVPQKSHLRKDEIGRSLSQEEFLSMVPAHEEGAVKVPKIIDIE